MSWIHMHPEDGAEGEIAELYDRLREQRGRVSNILKVHSLRPSALAHHLDLYMGLLFGSGGLSRAQREMIAVVVSRENQCEYCVSHHREALAKYVRDEDLLARVCSDYRDADLPPGDRALLDYASKLTASPAAVEESDVVTMRRSGYTDEDILLANLIVAYFNFVNRIALGLGVEHSEDEVGGYKV
ncbi:peroxidase-related enzyme [Lentisalinibacter sediminis]|uniref:peroxidase-related enzyme n=1 Tax=Lentisalinibacter sediminis TaxID=2992237 RepID=UPI0038659E7F